jgi:hypothetical protein
MLIRTKLGGGKFGSGIVFLDVQRCNTDFIVYFIIKKFALTSAIKYCPAASILNFAGQKAKRCSAWQVAPYTFIATTFWIFPHTP